MPPFLRREMTDETNDCHIFGGATPRRGTGGIHRDHHTILTWKKREESLFQRLQHEPPATTCWSESTVVHSAGGVVKLPQMACL